MMVIIKPSCKWKRPSRRPAAHGEIALHLCFITICLPQPREPPVQPGGLSSSACISSAASLGRVLSLARSHLNCYDAISGLIAVRLVLLPSPISFCPACPGLAAPPYNQRSSSVPPTRPWVLRPVSQPVHWKRVLFRARSCGCSPVLLVVGGCGVVGGSAVSSSPFTSSIPDGVGTNIQHYCTVLSYRPWLPALTP